MSFPICGRGCTPPQPTTKCSHTITHSYGSVPPPTQGPLKNSWGSPEHTEDTTGRGTQCHISSTNSGITFTKVVDHCHVKRVLTIENHNLSVDTKAHPWWWRPSMCSNRPLSTFFFSRFLPHPPFTQSYNEAGFDFAAMALAVAVAVAKGILCFSLMAMINPQPLILTWP